MCFFVFCTYIYIYTHSQPKSTAIFKNGLDKEACSSYGMMLEGFMSDLSLRRAAHEEVIVQRI